MTRFQTRCLFKERLQPVRLAHFGNQRAPRFGFRFGIGGSAKQLQHQIAAVVIGLDAVDNAIAARTADEPKFGEFGIVESLVSSRKISRDLMI